MNMQEVDIPSHFLCPISLQLMRDPVTISTGITYDREYIERWVFACKNATCPATKQPLPVDHDDQIMITPNHTLRRLIQSWCTLHASDGVERIPTPKQPPTVDRAYISKLLSDARRSSELRYTSLQRIRALLEGSDTRVKKLLEGSGSFGYVASVLLSEESDVIVKEKEEALWIMAQLEMQESELKSLGEDPFIDSLVGLLRSGSVDTRVLAMRVLKSYYGVADPNQLSSAKCDLFDETVRLIRDQGSKDGLKLLVELNPWGRNRVKAVLAGAVQVIVELLMEFGSGSGRRACELGLVVLDQLCGCAEGRAAMVGHGAGLAVVSKKILRVSHVASDRAVRILSSVSRYSATAKVLSDMVEVGVVAKLCLVIQVDCNAKTKERAKEILRLHSRVWKLSPCIPPHLLSAYPSR